MALERTFSIVKPDGVARNLIGEVLQRFEKAGLKVPDFVQSILDSDRVVEG